MSGGIPMSLARFMELGLQHPQHGYYSTKDKIFNKGGDFTTSPEISQMFGESLGIWMIAAMQNNYGGLGGTNGFTIAEVGPGSGLMMTDMLRTVSQFTDSLRNVDIALVEASPNLAAQQQERILAELQERQNIFLSYDLRTVENRAQEGNARGSPTEVKIERFHNKDLNFSISWYPDLKALYNHTLETQLAALETARTAAIKAKQAA